MYDVLLIGGGPAGMSAAIYLARQKLNVAMFTGVLGGQVIWSSDIENYLGLHQLTGVQLVQRFQKHLDDYREALDIHENEKVNKVERINGGFRAVTDTGSYDGKTVLLTTGSEHRTLGVPGEKEFENKGVTYCATCDAPLFKNKVVCVIGGGNSAMDAAIFVEKYATEVHLLTVNPELKGDESMKKTILASKKISIVPQAKTLRFEGKSALERVIYETPEGERALEVQGALIEIGLVPNSDPIDFVEKNKWHEIVVDKRNATNVEGVFAAGDVTDVTEKQIAVSVGEGSKAALSVIKYLQTVDR
jgi:alkyl hydroperoxide reductase subunit F